MGKEFVWTMTVDGEETPWICRVDESECVIIENGEETQRLKIENPQKKVGVLQIDSEVSVFGMKCDFQLENGIPYIKMEGKWKMSQTTFKERQDKYAYNQMVGGLAQGILGLVMCLAVLILYLVTGSTGKWWFVSILGSFMAVVGFSQWFALRKEVKQGK